MLIKPVSGLLSNRGVPLTAATAQFSDIVTFHLTGTFSTILSGITLDRASSESEVIMLISDALVPAFLPVFFLTEIDNTVQVYWSLPVSEINFTLAVPQNFTRLSDSLTAAFFLLEVQTPNPIRSNSIYFYDCFGWFLQLPRQFHYHCASENYFSQTVTNHYIAV